MARALVLIGSLAMLTLLAALTVKVAIDDGVTILVVISLVLLGFLGVGVLGALSARPPNE